MPGLCPGYISSWIAHERGDARLGGGRACDVDRRGLPMGEVLRALLTTAVGVADPPARPSASSRCDPSCRTPERGRVHQRAASPRASVCSAAVSVIGRNACLTVNRPTCCPSVRPAVVALRKCTPAYTRESAFSCPASEKRLNVRVSPANGAPLVAVKATWSVPSCHPIGRRAGEGQGQREDGRRDQFQTSCTPVVIAHA
jgi:hypothetical protein